MDSRVRANNTIYFKVMNDDMRIGGIYHSLDNSELRTMLILQAYASTNGKVYNARGIAYTSSELVALLGINWRTVKRTLQSLEDRGLITTDEWGINIVDFVETQNESDTALRKRRDKDYKNGVKTGLKQKQATVIDTTVHQALATANRTNILLKQQNEILEKIADNPDKKEYVDANTGEILE